MYVVVQLKCQRSISFVFAMVLLHLLFLTSGHIACIFNFLFASKVLRNVSIFLYFPVSFVLLLLCNIVVMFVFRGLYCSLLHEWWICQKT